MAIVTSIYRYKRPPWKRKPVAIDGPVIVTSVPVKKSRRSVLAREAAAEAGTGAPRPKGNNGEAATPATTARRVGTHDTSVKPQPAKDDGPRKPAIVAAKSGRRLRDERTAAEDATTENPPENAHPGEQHHPNPPTTAGKSAITVRDRNTFSASASSSRWRR